jgi:TolA-binding protein
MIPAVCLTLAADSTGRFSGKVVTKDGAGIPGATLLLERIEITWLKEITTGANGNFMQVGLEPRDFRITITAKGYAPMKTQIRVPLGDTITQTYTLLTPDQARAASGPVVSKDPGEAKATEGANAFNDGVAFYNDQKYAEALPFIEKAYLGLKEAAAVTTDATAKTETEAKLPTIERVYGIVLVESGKGDPAKKDQVLKAQPFLETAFAKNPKDQRVLVCLVEVANVKADPEMIKKYQGALDAMLGPRPELAYNEAVTFFNAEKYKEAKASLQKAMAADPKFADSYYLLGVVEFSLGNPKAAKENFKKYQEIAPTGKKAGEVKDFLRELK